MGRSEGGVEKRRGREGDEQTGRKKGEGTREEGDLCSVRAGGWSLSRLRSLAQARLSPAAAGRRLPVRMTHLPGRARQLRGPADQSLEPPQRL